MKKVKTSRNTVSRPTTARDVMNRMVPAPTSGNIRRGHLVRGMRDVNHIEWESWERDTSEYLRMVDKSRLDSANRFYNALDRVQTLFSEVRRRSEELQAAYEEMQATNEEMQATNEELQATTDELERTTAYRQTLLDTMLDVLLTTDSEGVITEVNKATERISGYSSDELIGKPLRQFFVDQDRAQAGIEQIKKESGISNYELTVLTKAGKEVPVSFNATVLRDPAGRITGLLGSARDVTKQRQAESSLKQTMAQLESSNKELEQFAYVASHDLQEPLRMVSSYTQLLEKRYKDKLDSDADEFIGYVVDGVSRMQNLINSLLTYSRVTTKGKALAKTDCEAVLEVTITNLKKAIEESSADITYDPLPVVRADDVQLGQLFQNLIGNAIKFRGKNNPRIHVSAEQKNSEWVFSVRDNGIGIEPQYHERIFQIFQRLHAKDEYPGTGVGLTICKKIVERHGGRIWVESKPGKGATFFFTLPTRGSARTGRKKNE
jgi:PAS domain S-box-containing protein